MGGQVSKQVEVVGGVALAVLVAGFAWAYSKCHQPQPPHPFTRMARTLNFVANTWYNLTGQHLFNPTWSELKPLLEKGNFKFFGGGSQTEEGLRLLCQGMEQSPGNGEASRTFHGGVVPSARLLMREILKKNLQHRYEVGAWIQKHPAILDIPVKKPIIITGLPRSGTTILSRLMSQDPKCRQIKMWEMLCNPPPPVKEQHDTDPRIDDIDHDFHQYDTFQEGWLGRFSMSHPTSVREQDEELLLFQDALKGDLWASQLMTEHAPYNKWVHDDGNSQEAYLYLHRYLQYLSSTFAPDADGGFFILKAPMHAYWQEAMMKQFPDARVVYCSRDPEKCIPSALRLWTTVNELYINHADPRYDDRERVRQRLNYLSEASRRLVESVDKDVVPGKQRFHANYNDMMQDPVAMVKSIYAHFGEQVTAEHEAAMHAYLSEHRQGKRGRASYTLQDFYQSKETLNADPNIKAYRQTFGV